MEETIICAEKICFKTGSHFLLKNIQWEVKKGQHWIIFGMNGSGKTTLLSIIAGFRPFTSGSLQIFGQEYNQQNILQLRRKIGWVSSSFFDHYYKNETAMEVILSSKFGTFGIDSNITDGDIKRVKQLLGGMGLAEKVNQPYRTMSKGERQNVLIARALFPKPQILLLDEPCSGLDILAREHTLAMVRYLAGRSDMTIIYVTHYTDEILEIFDHALLLRRGKIIDQGPLKALFTAEKLSNFLESTVHVQMNRDNGIQVTSVMKPNWPGIDQFETSM